MSAVFDAYAAYYDLLYKDKNYLAEAEYIAQHIRRQNPQAITILELGCGTGAHAEHLARMGFTVHGIDMSESMLERARVRKASLPVEISNRLSFSQGDVRTVRTGQTCDVVISLFHVMSYQTTNADLLAAMETAAVHLQKNGMFMFDYWYGPAVLTEQPSVRVKRLQNEEIAVTRIAEPVIHSNENVVDVNYTVLIKTLSTGRVDQVNETHKMRYLFLPEIDLLFALQSGWQRRLSLGWASELPPAIDDWAALSIFSRT